MSKAIPTVQKFMTTSPHTVGIEQTLSTAHRMMSTHHIRHLPVLHGGKLVGILSDRDMRLIETLREVDPETTTVEQAMSTTIYTTSPTSPLDEVAATMAEHKYGSAVVMDNHKVVGMVTTVDVCRALSELLRSRLSS